MRSVLRERPDGPACAATAHLPVPSHHQDRNTSVVARKRASHLADGGSR